MLKRQAAQRRLGRSARLKRGQTLTEYSTVIGIITAVLLAMTPMVRRSVQSMIKITADQVGIQKNSEQQFDDSGYLEHSYTTARSSTDQMTTSTNVEIKHHYDDWTMASTNMFTNLGFTPEGP